MKKIGEHDRAGWGSKASLSRGVERNLGGARGAEIYVAITDFP